MSIKGYTRQRIKRSAITGKVPTVYTGSDWTTDAIDTDVLSGEFYLNTIDNRLWICSSGSLFELLYESGSYDFVQLTDAPSTYVGQDGKLVYVSGSALAFGDISLFSVTSASYAITSSHALLVDSAITSVTSETASLLLDGIVKGTTYLQGDLIMEGVREVDFSSGSLYVDRIYGKSPIDINGNLLIDTTYFFCSSSIKVGINLDGTPNEGEIQYSGSDFFGYDGSAWLTLTGNPSGNYVTQTEFQITSASLFQVSSSFHTHNNLLIVDELTQGHIDGFTCHKQMMVSGNEDLYTAPVDQYLKFVVVREYAGNNVDLTYYIDGNYVYGVHHMGSSSAYDVAITQLIPSGSVFSVQSTNWNSAECNFYTFVMDL